MRPSSPRIPDLLVICVDRDDDIGQKAKIRTPVVGREDCLQAASELALADPEEADANAIFAAVRQFDELVGRGYRCQVSVVAGTPTGGFEADQKVTSELKAVAQLFDADGAVLVSDGAEDESIVPVLQTIVPVMSVHRVIIKHSKSVEESYVILGKYLRMLVSDPRFSKWVLGVPGAILLASIPLIYFDLLKEAFTIFASALGIVMLIKGFGVDRALSALPTLKPSEYIRLFSVFASLLIVIAAMVQAFAALGTRPEFQRLYTDPTLLFQYSPFLVGVFLGESLNFLWVGVAVYLGGSLLYHFLRGSAKVLRGVVNISILILLYFPFQQFALILQGKGSTQLLISFALFGLASTFIVVGLIYQYIQSRRNTRV